MIQVIIPSNPEFQKYELQVKKMYEQNQKKICDPNTFDFIRDNTLFYLFIYNEEVLGVIYYFVYRGKLFLNAFARRKSIVQNLYCLQWSTTWFKGDIYAEAQNRASALCLLRCGFKRIKNNLFVLKK